MKKFIVLPFVFYFLLQINSLSYGQDDRWVGVSLTSEIFWLLDKTTVQCNDGVYSAWAKKIFIDSTYHEVQRIHIKAKLRKLNITSVTRYFDNGNFDSDEISPDIWEDILPESVGESLLNYLLKQYPCE